MARDMEKVSRVPLLADLRRCCFGLGGSALDARCQTRVLHQTGDATVGSDLNFNEASFSFALILKDVSAIAAVCPSGAIRSRRSLGQLVRLLAAATCRPAPCSAGSKPGSFDLDQRADSRFCSTR
eukprot:3847128-Rhodomonas_salina.1